VALVIALAVAAVILVVGTGTMTVVMATANTVGDHVAVVAAEQAAASGLAEAEQTVQSDIAAGDAVLPCSVVGSAPGGSLAENYDVTMTYYQQLQGTSPDGALSCSGGQAPDQQVAAVAFLATGRAGGSWLAIRAVDQVANGALTPVEQYVAAG
jgi:hypothetical protein